MVFLQRSRTNNFFISIEKHKLLIYTDKYGLKIILVFRLKVLGSYSIIKMIASSLLFPIWNMNIGLVIPWMNRHTTIRAPEV